MKRILFLSIFLASVFTASAQTWTMSKTADTAVNATTVYLNVKSAGYVPVTTMQLNVIKVSGTVAGTAIVQGSLDGTNYSTISTDTLTLTDASQSKTWALGASNYLHYRIKYTTSGTQRSVPSGMTLFRK